MLIGIGLVLVGLTLAVASRQKAVGKVGRLYLAEDYAGARAAADRGLEGWNLPASKFALAYNAAGAAHHEGLFAECLERLSHLETEPASLQRHLVSSLRATTLLLQGTDLKTAREEWATARAIRKWKYDDAISALLFLREGDRRAAKEAFNFEATVEDPKPKPKPTLAARQGATGLLLQNRRTRAIESFWRGLYLHEAQDSRANAHLERAATSGIRSVYSQRAKELLK